MNAAMSRRLRTPIFSWGFGLLTLAVLLANVPDSSHLNSSLWLFFAGLVALMLNLGSLLNEGVVSPASTAALMAYLTLGEAGSAAAALWCVTAGTLIGDVVWLLRTIPSGHSRREYARVIRSITMGTAQLTLGVFVAGAAYQAVDGRLPLDRLTNADIAPLGIFAVVYLAVYWGVMFLEAYFSRQRTPRIVFGSWEGGIEIVLLPLPFAVVGAVAYHELSQLAFFILIGGLLIVAMGMNLLSRAQTRYRQQVQELSALSAVSQAMRTGMDLNALLTVVYTQVSQLLHVTNFTVALFDANRGTVYFPLNVVNGRAVSLDPRDVENGLMEYVIHEKTPLLLADQVPRRAGLMGLAPPMMPVFSWLGVPLLASSDRVLGCIVVFSNRPDHHFTQKDLQLLVTIAGQAGTAADNAQLYTQARDRAVQLATLNNVVTILSGTLDVQQVLDLVGSSAVAVAGCNAVALYMWWTDMHHSPLLARHTGLSTVFVENPPRPLILDIDDLHRRRQPVIVTDAHIDQRILDEGGAMAREYKRAWVEFLLRKGDDLLGILVFLYDEPRRFGPEEIELLRNFTNQASLAISNARLYTQTDEALKRRVEQLSVLADISRELASTLHMQGLFQVVLDRAIEATQSQTGALLLRADDEEGRPELVASRGIAPETFAYHNPLADAVAQTFAIGQPTVMADGDEAGTLSQLIVPIMHGDDVLGVITLGSDHPDDYSQDDLSFVAQLANQARIAIDNARLFRRIEIARDRLQVILDSMKEAVILIGAEGRIMLANPRVQPLLGLDPAQILGVPINHLLETPALHLAERMGFLPDSLVHLVQGLGAGHWDESSTDGKRLTFPVTADGKQRFLDRTDAPVCDAAGQVLGLLMVFADVTEERELAQAREDLSSMIVHDLRGPLTAVTTSLKLLGEIAPPDDPLGRAVKQTTDTSSRAVRKLLNLVDSLLDVSKLESGMMTLEREPTELLPLCTSVVSELSPLAHELDVDLVVEVPADLPLLDTDAEKVERIVLNLVDNAIKFTPSGGRVIVHAYQPGDCGVEAGMIRVDVSDTGPGIPDDYKVRLFDRFSQVDRQRGRRRGTGLGLTFCRLAIEAHGGAIWVEDNPKGGAIFAFSLPVADLDEVDDLQDESSG